MPWRRCSCAGKRATLSLRRSRAVWSKCRCRQTSRWPTAFVRPLIKGQEQKLLYACTRNQRYIRGLIAAKIDMKFMPELRFRSDTALEYADKIDEILNSPEVARDLKKDE